MASAPEEDNPKETTQPEIFPHPTEIHGGQGAEPDDLGDDHDCGDDVDDRAIQIAARAGLTLFVGARFYTCGPEPCAVEYSGVPGERRGRVETGTEVTVLEYLIKRTMRTGGVKCALYAMRSCFIDTQLAAKVHVRCLARSSALP